MFMVKAEKADYYSLTHKIYNKSFKQSSSYRPVQHDYYQNNRDSNRNFLLQRDSVDYKPSNTPANYRPKECSDFYKTGHNEHECYKKLRQQNTHKEGFFSGDPNTRQPGRSFHLPEHLDVYI